MHTNCVVVLNHSTAVRRRDPEDTTVVHANTTLHAVNCETATVLWDEE